MRPAFLLALCAAGLLLAGATGAQEPEGWAYEIANELMSPYCPGRTLAECPSPQAETLRMWIIVQEAAGRTRDEVTAELLERYGDEMLAAPRAEGFGIVAYAIPVLLFAAGGVLVAVFLRRQTGGGDVPVPGPTVAAEGPAAPLDPELERLVDEDLAR